MKSVLFDLDGTLLFMNQKEFVKVYFMTLSNKLSSKGYDSKLLLEGVNEAIKYIVTNDDFIINEEKFWSKFSEITNIKKDDVSDLLEEYFNNDFNEAKSTTHINKYAIEIINKFKEKGYNIILATNPLFPKIATYERIKWAGLRVEMFDYISTYENSHYCKPNIHYYQEIIQKLNLNTDETIMIGNDVIEDGIVSELGIKCYITSDCILNHDKFDKNKLNLISFKHLLSTIDII